MRIIAGYLGGRIFDSPETGNTHPMGEKPRGAIFNALGDIEGLTVLDAYAGSGALGFEAISRGAKSVVAVELDKQAYKTIVDNIFKLGLEDKVHAVISTMRAWSNKNQNLMVDIAICDPPYDAVLALEIERLVKHVKKNGLLVLSWPSKLEAPPMPGCEILNEKEYAGARIVFYRKS
ncbi:MAG: putative Methyltransferase [Candidatus Saccharibacteria bacterium]|nr:putative Methyltransferase [Candidatus Saccharibacteria bacterium]